MKISKLLIGLSGCCLCTLAWAEDLKPDQVMSLSVSDKGITRLSVEGSPIQEIFLYPDTMQNYVTLHKSGNVFIAGESIEGPMSMTIITNNGDIQDLKVNTTSKTVAPILLKPIKKTKVVDRKAVQAWLEDFGRGFIPSEFRRIGVSEQDRSTEQYLARASDSFINDTHVVTTFEVSSKSEETIQLEANKFTRPGEGIHVLKNVLEPNEITKIIMIKKKDF
jgi:hypothetical protein